jgi:hypothetical protein
MKDKKEIQTKVFNTKLINCSNKNNTKEEKQKKGNQSDDVNNLIRQMPIAIKIF